VNDTASQLTRPPKTSAASLFGTAAAVFTVVLVLFWFVARRFAMNVRIGGHMPSAFIAFALLLGPYWFFAFGLADILVRLRSAATRMLAPLLLIVPYVVISVPRGEFSVAYALLFAAFCVGPTALFVLLPPIDNGLSWQDALVLIAVGVPVEFGLLRGAFPRALGVFPKFLLMDAMLYAYLVVRRLPGIGYDLRLRWRDLLVGLREWALFAPMAVVLGTAIGFIRFRPYWPELGSAAAGWLITFFFVALPEELFFRGLLQNLLERRFTSSVTGVYPAEVQPPGENVPAIPAGIQSLTLPIMKSGARLRALLIASALFGLSHFNKPLPFNWRYVILATIAGLFYGRAWLDRRHLGCPAITHATVDMVWGLWFHK
jgi:uncharacterized protein